MATAPMELSAASAKEEQAVARQLMIDNSPNAEVTVPKLAGVPNSILAIPVGLSATANFFKTIHTYGFPWVSDWVDFQEAAIWIVWTLSVIALFLVVCLYAAKAFFFRSLVREEFRHPARVNLFFAPLISLLLITLGLPPSIENKGYERAVWVIVILVQTVFDIWLFGRWLFGKKRHLGNAQILYLMAVVGWFLLANLGAKHVFPNLAFLSFSVGTVFFFLVFITLFQNVHKLPLEARRNPLLFLFVAPPSVASIAWFQISGTYDYISQFYFSLAAFMFLLVLRLWFEFVRGHRFSLAWWAYTFPMMAFANTMLLYAHEVVDNWFTRGLALVTGLLALTALGFVFFRTIYSAMSNTLFNDPLAVEHLRSNSYDMPGFGTTSANDSTQVADTGRVVV